MLTKDKGKEKTKVNLHVVLVAWSRSRTGISWGTAKVPTAARVSRYAAKVDRDTIEITRRALSFYKTSGQVIDSAAQYSTGRRRCVGVPCGAVAGLVG